MKIRLIGLVMLYLGIAGLCSLAVESLMPFVVIGLFIIMVTGVVIFLADLT